MSLFGTMVATRSHEEFAASPVQTEDNRNVIDIDASRLVVKGKSSPERGPLAALMFRALLCLHIIN